MNDLSGAVRRLCIALDTDGPGGRGGSARTEVRRRLFEIIVGVSEETGLDRLYLAERGTPAGAFTTRPRPSDGLLFVLPAGVSEARVIAGFAGELRLALARCNGRLGKGAPGRLRLRVAFHQGPTQVADGAFAGRAVDAVCLLRDSEVLKAALRRNPDADLGVIISGHLFEDVIEYEHRDLRRHAFRRVALRQEGPLAEAWISVPGTVAQGRAIMRRTVRLPGTLRRRRSSRPGPVVNFDEY